MDYLLQVQMNIVFSILLIILFVHTYFNMNRKKTTNRLYMWIIGLTCITLVLEIFSVLLNNPELKQFMVLHKLVNIIGFMLTPIIPFVGCIFIKEWINRYRKEKLKTNNILLIPLFINGIGALMSYNSSVLFHVTSENVYQRGPLFFILPFVSYLYFGYSLYFIYMYRKKFTHSELVIFNLFYIAPIIFTSIQLKYSFYLTTWNTTAIVIVVTYILILNDQAYRDSLTGLENHLSYEYLAQNIDKKKLSKFSVVYMDVDKFKSINDQYGHREGDEALKAFADLLIESFPQRLVKLIRLGGDEFLIIIEEQQQEKIEEYIQVLIQKVEMYNYSAGKPYRIRFSYGMVCYTNVYESIYQMQEYADQLMYEQKQRKKVNC